MIPLVDRVLKAAAQALQASGKSGAIDGYTHGAKRAWELASGIWTAVLQRKLHYTLPPASFEHRGQKVRTPGQVLDAGLATCMDLTLLFASCLEQANLNPLLIFTQGHAFVGLWLRDEEFSTAVVDDITAVRKRLQLRRCLRSRQPWRLKVIQSVSVRPSLKALASSLKRRMTSSS